MEACRLRLAEGGELRAEGEGHSAEGKKEKAQEHLAIAKALIEEMGYGRRKPEAEELEKQMHSTQA